MEPRSPLRALVVSDLHVDHAPNRPKAKALADAWGTADADVLVIAGDVSHRLEQLEATLGQFSGFPGPKLFVPGNHDIWIVDPGRESFADSWHKLEGVALACRRQGFRCLEDRNVEVGGFTFVGSIGWYDYSFASPSLGLRPQDYAVKTWGELTYMDARYARWGASDEAVLDRLLDGLAARMDRAKPPIVLVTHHLPLESLVVRRNRPGWDFFNAFMGSRKIEALAEAHKIRRFVFGHSHQPVHRSDPAGWLVNNPLGYPREGLTPNASPFLLG